MSSSSSSSSFFNVYVVVCSPQPRIMTLFPDESSCPIPYTLLLLQSFLFNLPSLRKLSHAYYYYTHTPTRHTVKFLFVVFNRYFSVIKLRHFILFVSSYLIPHFVIVRFDNPLSLLKFAGIDKVLFINSLKDKRKAVPVLV